MVRKSNTVSLGDAIKEFLDQYKHSGKIREAEIANAWPAVMGHNIAKLTLNVFYKNGKLVVQLKTPL
ncbi:MAG TPA: DciA family protein, partial [Tenuifilaceae bacterium]|nr:DciA family protein [Tenuifilaceae bacterium]